MSEQVTPTSEGHSNRASAAEVFIERPIAELAKFVGKSTETLLRGIADPWGLGLAIANKSPRLPAPFTFLVISFFVAGLSFRLCRALAMVPQGIGSTFMDDLHTTLSEVSLLKVIAATLPCVLIVVASGKLLSLLGATEPKLENNRVVLAACYSVGWQSLIVTLFALFGILLTLGGHDPQHYMNNLVVNVAALLTILWGALILTPVVLHVSVQSRKRSVLLRIVASGALAFTSFITSILVLNQSMNLAEAGEIRKQRQLAALEREVTSWIGALQADVLKWEQLSPESDSHELQFQLTVAFTNRVKTLLIIPRQDVLLPMEDPRITFTANSLRVVSSSIDKLSDRALLIKPEETRVAEFVIEIIPDEQIQNEESKHRIAPYWVHYHRLGQERAFYEDNAVLLPPREMFEEIARLPTEVR